MSLDASSDRASNTVDVVDADPGLGLQRSPDTFGDRRSADRSPRPSVASAWSRAAGMAPRRRAAPGRGGVLRLDIARPSGSRTVGCPITSTPRSRSADSRRTTASCWKSFSPNTATSGRTAVNSLVTTVVTPSKWPGRAAPSIVAGEFADRHRGAEAGSYIAPASGCVDRVDAQLSAHGDVGVDRAGVVVEVVRPVELQRVDEDRHDGHVGDRPGVTR